MKVRILLLFLGWIGVGNPLGNCAGTHSPLVLPPIEPWELNAQGAAPSHFALAWSQRLPGAISSMSVSRAGDVLAATNPDPDIEGSSSKFWLTRLTPQGKIAWQQLLPAPAKDLDLSADGTLAVVSTHEDELIAYNVKGKSIWNVQGTCRPTILNKSRRVLCYHDEDVDPQIAFEIYDWAGKKKVSFPIRGDVLSFRLSRDEKGFVMGLTGGRVLYFNTNGKLLWEKRIAGEIVDVAIASQGPVRAAILTQQKIEGLGEAVLKGLASALVGADATAATSAAQAKSTLIQVIETFDGQGQRVGQFTPPIPVVQLDLDNKGERVFYYSNGTCLNDSPHSRLGQVLGSFQVEGAVDRQKSSEKQAAPVAAAKGGASGGFAGGPGAGVKNGGSRSSQKWLRGVSAPAIYFHPPRIESDQITLGIEENSNSDRKNLLLLIGFDGQIKDQLPLPSDEGAIFYTHRFVEKKSPIAIVATDDGRVSWFGKKK